MANVADPYHRWLGIPPNEQPPTMYRLLGLTAFEEDVETIREAALRQLAHVRTHVWGDDSVQAGKLLNELEAARSCLLDPERKTVYDAGLRLELGQDLACTRDLPVLGLTPIGSAHETPAPATDEDTESWSDEGPKAASADVQTTGPLPAGQRAAPATEGAGDVGSKAKPKWQAAAEERAEASPTSPAGCVGCAGFLMGGVFFGGVILAALWFLGRLEVGPQPSLVPTPGRTTTAVGGRLPLRVASIGTRTIEPGGALALAVVALDPNDETPELRWSAVGALPSGATLDAKTGWLEWSPTIDAPDATHPVSIRVTSIDPATPAAVATFELRVARAAEPTLSQETVAGRPKYLVNSLAMRLAFVPPGEFMMGSPETEIGRMGPEKQHRVKLTKGFRVSVHEVTQGEYQRVMGVNPSYFQESVLQGDASKHPVETVAWVDAVEFCRRLSELPAEKSEGRLYRLPTEAEWEYACRAGSGEAFHAGPRLPSSLANCDGTVPYAGGPLGPYLTRPARVGSYPANAFGLHDMHGNVWEWCQDWHDPGYYTSSPEENPPGPSSGTERVVRGGGWFNAAMSCRSARRFSAPPEARADSRGFRVVLESGE